MRIAALDHIVLNVEDVERSLQFYQHCLGLAAERVDAWRRGELPFPSLRINDATLIDLVHSQPPAGDGPALTRPNLAHFCLVTDEPELTELGDALRQAGVPIEAGPAIRSGARGDALSIYFRDPDHNLIEVRTYARRPLIRAAIEDARARVRASIDALQTPDAPLAGNAAWSQKDLIAHLTSIEGWFRKQIEIFVDAQPWDLESVDDFNARAVAERRDWSMQRLTDELEREAAALQELLERLDESDLNRVYEHPRRTPRKLADGWMMLHSHTRRHLAELQPST
jgi:catechol 2,3-dioxygenase-like lactoylglutathione lyase family enzyme